MPDFHLVSNNPRLLAPFSHAVGSDGWALLAGQTPSDLDAPNARLPDRVAVQTRQVMENLTIVLNGVGLDLRAVVQCRGLPTKSECDDATFDETYQRYVPSDRLSARTTVGVRALAVSALVEIDCIARRPQ